MSDNGLQMSAEISELATALAVAQGEIKAASKDRDNPFFKSRYATLDAVWDAIRGPLSSHGLSVVQGLSAQEAALTVTTMLIHASGQWLKSAATFVARDASPQALGSAATYGRRYGLSALVGVTAEEDDDGNAAQPNGRKADPRAFMKPPKVTAPVDEIGKPDRPQTHPDEHAVEAAALFQTPDEEAERNTLVAEAIRLAKLLKLNPKERDAFKAEFLGGADIYTADVSALSTMVAELRKREPK